MTDVTYVGRDGKESKMEYVYICGLKVWMMVILDMLKYVLMFKRIDLKFDLKGGKK